MLQRRKTMKDTQYVIAPAVFMRKNPAVESEVVSETFYSEEVDSIAKEKEWVHIATVADGYLGWVPRCAVVPGMLGETICWTNRCVAHLYTAPSVAYGPMLSLPYGCRLCVMDASDPRWIEVGLLTGQKAFIQRGDVAFDKTSLTLDSVAAFAKRFLGLPYTWGGRTSFGFDCSGFVQMLYREMGIAIPRDAKEQCASEQFRAVPLTAVQAGDLVFFGNDVPITHVGMCLNDKEFIHATVAENMPYLRISRFVDKEWNDIPVRVAKRIVTLCR